MTSKQGEKKKKNKKKKQKQNKTKKTCIPQKQKEPKHTLIGSSPQITQQYITARALFSNLLI